MLDYIEEDGHNKSDIDIHIGDEEWAKCGYQDKLRLLYLLKQNRTELAQFMAKRLAPLIEEERRLNTIDIEATLKHIESGE